MEKVTDLLKGGAVSDEAYEMVFSCTGPCGLCDKACPESLMPYFAFIAAIAKIARAGKEPPALSYQFTPGHRYNFPNVFGALQIKPSEVRWIKRVPPQPEPADVVFFTGCAAAGMPHIVLEIIGLLEKMGIDFVTLAGGELCCGASACSWCDLAKAESVGQTFVSAIAAFRPKKTVFFCHGCYMMCLLTLP